MIHLDAPFTGSGPGTLVRPAVVYRDTYLRGLAELQGEGWIWYADHDLAEIAADFGAHVRRTEAMIHFRQGDIVPETELWCIVDGEFAGRVSIRHELNDSLREIGGHIGYDTVPRFRGRGVATEMLRQSLPIARELGITRALVTTTEDNLASARVIEKNGGILTGRRELMAGRVVKRYYWIEL